MSKRERAGGQKVVEKRRVESWIYETPVFIIIHIYVKKRGEKRE